MADQLDDPGARHWRSPLRIATHGCAALPARAMPHAVGNLGSSNATGRARNRSAARGVKRACRGHTAASHGTGRRADPGRRRARRQRGWHHPALDRRIAGGSGTGRRRHPRPVRRRTVGADDRPRQRTPLRGATARRRIGAVRSLSRLPDARIPDPSHRLAAAGGLRRDRPQRRPRPCGVLRNRLRRRGRGGRHSLPHSGQRRRGRLEPPSGLLGTGTRGPCQHLRRAGRWHDRADRGLSRNHRFPVLRTRCDARKRRPLLLQDAADRGRAALARRRGLHRLAAARRGGRPVRRLALFARRAPRPQGAVAGVRHPEPGHLGLRIARRGTTCSSAARTVTISGCSASASCTFRTTTTIWRCARRAMR